MFVNWATNTNWRYLAVTLIRTYGDVKSFTAETGVS